MTIRQWIAILIMLTAVLVILSLINQFLAGIFIGVLLGAQAHKDWIRHMARRAWFRGDLGRNKATPKPKKADVVRVEKRFGRL